MSFFAKGRLPIFANADAAATSFEIARALPGGANRRLMIELFDMGDGSSPGTLQILPPIDSNFTVFPGCTFDLSGPSAPTEVAGDVCKIVDVTSAAGYQGQLLTVEVPIDETYTCNFHREQRLLGAGHRPVQRWRPRSHHLVGLHER